MVSQHINPSVQFEGQTDCKLQKVRCIITNVKINWKNGQANLGKCLVTLEFYITIGQTNQSDQRTSNNEMNGNLNRNFRNCFVQKNVTDPCDSFQILKFPDSL